MINGYRNSSQWGFTNERLKIKVDSGLYEFGKADLSPIAFVDPKFYHDRGCPIDLRHGNSIKDDDLRNFLWEDIVDFR